MEVYSELEKVQNKIYADYHDFFVASISGHAEVLAAPKFRDKSWRGFLRFKFTSNNLAYLYIITLISLNYE
jgi:hypothetical protein